MIQNFDMHIHTNNSDGEYSVREIIKKVKEKGIKIFSITDHDNLRSLEEIKEFDLEGLHFIPGIEITGVLDNKYEVHILGYNINENSESLLKILEYLKEFRMERFYETLRLLKRKHQMFFDQKDILAILKRNKNPGKPHIARMMIRYNYCNSVKEAFDLYLSKLKINVPNEMSVRTITKAIHKAGGIAVLAHPKGVENMYKIKIDEIIKSIRRSHIDGLEIYNSIHSFNDCLRYEKIAKKYNLLTTGGSDYHGPNIKNDVKLGVLYKSQKEVKINFEDFNLEPKVNSFEKILRKIR